MPAHDIALEGVVVGNEHPRHNQSLALRRRDLRRCHGFVTVDSRSFRCWLAYRRVICPTSPWCCPASTRRRHCPESWPRSQPGTRPWWSTTTAPPAPRTRPLGTAPRWPPTTPPP